MSKAAVEETVDQVIRINNNVKELKINEKPAMHDSEGATVKDEIDCTDHTLDVIKEQSFLMHNGHTLPVGEKPEVLLSPKYQTFSNPLYPGDLTDDTASDSRSAEGVLTSEASGRMYESDDIVLDDEDLSSIARSNSVDYLKEKAIVMLQQELEHARKELELKDEKCKELTGVRSKVEAELEELTASLFEEAHKMVHDANMKQFVAEKRLNAAIGEIEALRTEVSALKSLVLTSTPSNPNPQSHPQLIKKKKDILGSPLRKHRRNRSDADTQKPVQAEDKKEQKIVKMGKEVDSVVMAQLNNWLKRSSVTPRSAVNLAQSNQSQTSNQNEAPAAVNHSQANQTELTSITNPNSQIKESDYDTIEYETMAPMMSQLIQRIETEDIKPCLTFSQMSLAEKVSNSVHNNSLMIEPISKPLIQQCALSGVMICCKHKIKCGNAETWYPISQSCRTRIASVCDFLTYISYIKKGLVKHSKEQIYWEMNRLRREMSLAKLGYYKEE